MTSLTAVCREILIKADDTDCENSNIGDQSSTREAINSVQRIN